MTKLKNPVREFTHKEKIKFIEYALRELHKDKIEYNNGYLCHHLEAYCSNILQINTTPYRCTFKLTKIVFPEMNLAMLRTRKGKRHKFDGVGWTAVWEAYNYTIRIRFLKLLMKKIVPTSCTNPFVNYKENPVGHWCAHCDFKNCKE